MKLYHGTSSSILESVLEKGLTPRYGAIGNWDHLEGKDSISEHVYLTSTYGAYFASVAAAKSNADSLILIEVDLDDLDTQLLYPDEDFIVEKASDIPEQVDAWDYVRTNIKEYQSYWELSLNRLGNISHKGGIPIESITRIAQFNVSDCPWLGLMAADACISTMAFQFMGDHHRTLTQFLMTDPIEISDLLSSEFEIVQGEDDDFAKVSQQRIDFWSKIIAEPKSEIVYRKES